MAGVAALGAFRLAPAAPPPPAELRGGGEGMISPGAVPGWAPGSGVHGFPDGAPARVTGGFGEDSCLSCHWEFEGRAVEAGSLAVRGLPSQWEAGGRYPVQVVLEHPEMAVGGFQLSARFAADTSQAGRFAVPEGEKGRVMLLEEGGLHFAQHREAGIEVAPGEDRIAWEVVWVAPERGGGSILLHGAAVAGDGDRSQMGDWVHHFEKEIEGTASREDRTPPVAQGGPGFRDGG